MEARNRKLSEWLNRIKNRQLVLPRFQRYEAWSHSQITELFNTLLMELPAGAILTLEIGEEEPFISRPIVGAPDEGERIIEHLLDGQQRLTVLWRAFNDDYDERSFFVKIEEDENENPLYAISVSRYEKNNRSYPLWASSPTQTWERKLIPVQHLRPDVEAETAFKNWAKEASGDESEKHIKLIEIGHKIRSLFSGYSLPFLSLPSSTNPEIALDVFIRMNTSASPLTPFDIVVAQIEAATGNSLHGYLEEINQEVPNLGRYTAPQNIVLAVSALLQSKMPSKATYLSKEYSSNFDVHWPKIMQGIKKAVSFLTEEKVFDARRLPSDIVLYVLSALWANADDGLDEEGRTRTHLRKYMWRAFFSERYDRTTTARAFSDYKGLVNLLSGGSGNPEIFNNEHYPIAQVDEIANASWPYRKDRLARAILLVSLKSGGFDFADGAIASYESIQSREYHHVFPDSWLRKQGYKTHQINKALNCALISWRTNRNISAKEPAQYVAERMARSSLGEPEVRRRIKSHLIPVDELVDNNYDEFIMTRAKLVSRVAERLCNGEIVESLV